MTMVRPHHFRKSTWFHAVVAELERLGFNPGGRCAPHTVKSYVRKGVFVEISGGQTLRVVYPNGAAYIHHVPKVEDAVLTINAAELSGDFPD